MTMRTVKLTVNGTGREAVAESRRTLADFLREDLGLTGTHVGCEHGVCGACTVLLDGRAVRSCLLLAAQADGAEVTTIEGLARDGAFHPLQEALRRNHSFQCGFCTPGFVMTALEIVNDGRSLTDDELRHELGGNLCRCTGYQSIVEGVSDALRQSMSPEAAE